jgi:hypothetical protein
MSSERWQSILASTLIRLETLTVNEEKWQRAVTIDTPGVGFPVEHILMILEKHAN